jgi:hypothetical protein
MYTNTIQFGPYSQFWSHSFVLALNSQIGLLKLDFNTKWCIINNCIQIHTYKTKTWIIDSFWPAQIATFSLPMFSSFPMFYGVVKVIGFQVENGISIFVIQ